MKTTRVEEVMTRHVKSCRPGNTLADAARIMWENDCGCVPVVDEKLDVLGMLTDRDVCMAAYTQGLPLHAISVASSMSKKVHGIGPGDSLKAAEALMIRHQIRRLPVLGFERQLVGILSINDLIRATATRDHIPVEGMTPEAIEQTLAAVCQPRMSQVTARA